MKVEQQKPVRKPFTAGQPRDLGGGGLSGEPPRRG
jgi:hypothetical protein